MLNKYNFTKVSCYLGFFVQAIVVNLVPLLFVCIQDEFNIDLAKLTLIITITFFVQLVIDALSTRLIEKLGYRLIAILAHICSCVGLLLLGFLPFIMNNHYLGIVISIMIASLGAGFIEVIISPIVEAIPGKRSNMGLNFLHSSYCWGVAVVVLLTTLYVKFLGSYWRYLPMVCAIFPFVNIIAFIFVPIEELKAENEESKMSLLDLLKNKVFLACLLMIVCAGATELAIAQWASYFAERGLNVSKTMGDLLGPLAFAILMGTARILSGVFADKIGQEKIIIFSAIGCIISYVIIIVSPAVISLIGCALCGFFVGATWPGILNIAAKKFKNGESKVFSIMALGGDAGCMLGPTIVGAISNCISSSSGDGLRIGILVAIVFPVLLLALILFVVKYSKKENLSK